MMCIAGIGKEWKGTDLVLLNSLQKPRFLILFLITVSPNINFIDNSGLQVTSNACTDDLDFMEQINQELEVLSLSQEGVIKRSVRTKYF